MNCSKCGNLLTEGVVSCSKCGTPVASAVVATAPLSRPLVITALAVLQFIHSAAGMILGIGLIASFPKDTLGEVVATTVVGFILAAVLAFNIFAGIGLLRLRKYGRILAIISSVADLIWLFPYGSIIPLAILIYLFRPDVKDLFSEMKPEELSSEEITLAEESHSFDTFR